MIIYDYVTDYIYIWSLKNMDDYSGYGLTYGSTKWSAEWGKHGEKVGCDPLAQWLMDPANRRSRLTPVTIGVVTVVTHWVG